MNYFRTLYLQLMGMRNWADFISKPTVLVFSELWRMWHLLLRRPTCSEWSLSKWRVSTVWKRRMKHYVVWQKIKSNYSISVKPWWCTSVLVINSMTLFGEVLKFWFYFCKCKENENHPNYQVFPHTKLTVLWNPSFPENVLYLNIDWSSCNDPLVGET